MGNHMHPNMPSRQYRPSPLGPNQLGSRLERPFNTAPPILGTQRQSQSQQAVYLAHAEQEQWQYQYAEYAPSYYPAPMTGYEDNRPNTAPFGAAAPRAATFAAPSIARTPSLGQRVRNGLHRLGRALSFRRRRRPVVADEDGGEEYFDEVDLNERQQRPQTAAEGAEENPPRAPVARAVFFDGIVDRAGHLASPPPPPPPPPGTPVANRPGPSAAARRRAKFTGDDDDLYYKTVGRDAESGVTYRESRYK